MIKLIAAIDLLRGIANDDGVPWDLPSYQAYLEKKKSSSVISDPTRFDDLIHQASTLYITQLSRDFECTKFFPPFEDKFKLIKKTPIKRENGIEFQHQVWQRK